MEHKNAFGFLTIKSVNDRTRTFTGIASTITPDRMGDVVEPRGATFKLPMPFLDQHDAGRPIGKITAARVSGNAIEVDGYIDSPTPDAPASIVERMAAAYYELKRGLKSGLSIGFNPIESSHLKDSGGIHFKKWEWLELSLVTIPAQQNASVLTVKTLFNSRPALRLNANSSGATQPPAGATALPVKGNSMNTLSQQIATLRDTRGQKAARAKELDELRTNENRAFTEDERTEVRAITAELSDINDDIAVKEAQMADVVRAQPVQLPGAVKRAPMVFARNADPDDKFKGESLMRKMYAQAAAVAMQRQGNLIRASEVAEHRWGKQYSQLVAVIKANEVPGGGTGSGEWGAELVAVDNRYTGDFIEYLHDLTVFDRLPLRSVPAHVAIKGQDGVSIGYWVGESKAIPATTGDFSSTSTTPLKVGALCVMSNELIRDSSPSAMMWMRDSLGHALTERIDTTFLSTTAATPGVSPAGILNSVAPGTSSGNDAAAIRADLLSLLSGFITAKNVRGLYLVTTPSLAASLGMMRNALGQTEFPGITAEGGTGPNGYPILVGDNVGAGDVILLDPKEIWKIGDSGVQFSVSTETMIEQSTAPTGATDTPVAASQAFTSMFQEESTAIKVVRSINYAKRRAAGVVAWIGDADWGNEGSP